VCICLIRVFTYFPQGIAILTVVLLPRRQLVSRIRTMLEDVRCKVLDKAERKGGKLMWGMRARAGGAQPCGGKNYKFWSATSKSSSHFPFEPPKSDLRTASALRRSAIQLYTIRLPIYAITASAPLARVTAM
jgi:hypothetical protein